MEGEREIKEEEFEEYLSTEKSKIQSEIENKAQEGTAHHASSSGPLSKDEIEKALQELPLVGSLREVYNFLSKSFLDVNVEYGVINEISIRIGQSFFFLLFAEAIYFFTEIF